jgi:hypothetical protein
MLNIKGLKAISGETKSLKGCYDANYLQLVYNKETGEAWTHFFSDLGHSWQTHYKDNNIINCGNICTPKTQKELREIIENSISENEYLKQ